MSNRLAVVVAVSAVSIAGAVASCSFGNNGDFACDPTSAAATCGPQGVCQPDGFCSIPDGTCDDTHQRYGEDSGPKSGSCVPAGVGSGSDMPDGGGSGSNPPPPDAQTFCYGSTRFVNICFATAPTGDITISNLAPTVINTDTDTMCAPSLSGGEGYCVVAAATIKINSIWRATGSKLLVLVASDSITGGIGGQIDVGSRRSSGAEVGAGHDPTLACTSALDTAPTSDGGGAGGNFAGQAGNGGNSQANGAGLGGTRSLPAPVTSFRGGCAGQAGDATPNSGGHGGGGVFLIAGNTIDFSIDIVAGGEGGAQGIGNDGGGGGGGGAGGMIGLDAPTVRSTGALVANGGGGGGASGGGNDGRPGDSATGVGQAKGGASGNTGRGNDTNRSGFGGGGAFANDTTQQPNGDPGDNGTGSHGGGGGGGGAGYILATKGAALGNKVSPTPTILP